MEYKDKKTKNITNPIVTDYLVENYRPDSKLVNLRNQAEVDGIPIITLEAESYLSSLLSIVRPQKILEIGTAVGYSAMFFSEQCGAEVYTVEKDHETYVKALQNIEEYGFSDRIHVYEGDGEAVVSGFADAGIKDFDFVFIDAAKSHYKAFLDAAISAAADDCVFVADNVLFQAKVASDEYDPGGKHKTNIRRLREFNHYIMTDERFISTIIAVGDGISVTKLR